MDTCLNPKTRKDLIEWIYQTLKPHANKFDAIAVCGMSMALVAPTIADRLNKNLILVRKGGERTHSDLRVEGVRDGRYIIIDDIIDTGDTLLRVTEQIEKFNKYAVCVCVIQYHHQKVSWAKQTSQLTKKLIDVVWVVAHKKCLRTKNVLPPYPGRSVVSETKLN